MAGALLLRRRARAEPAEPRPAVSGHPPARLAGGNSRRAAHRAPAVAPPRVPADPSPGAARRPPSSVAASCWRWPALAGAPVPRGARRGRCSRPPATTLASEASIDVLEGLPPGALAISDDPGIVWRAGRRTPPDLVDASILRIESGNLTARSIADSAADPDVCAVVVRSTVRWGSLRGPPRVVWRRRATGWSRTMVRADASTSPSGAGPADLAHPSGRRAAAQAVEVAQAGGAIDHRRERHPLRRDVEQHQDHQHDRANRSARLQHHGQPEHGPEEVGPGVAEHQALSEVGAAAAPPPRPPPGPGPGPPARCRRPGRWARRRAAPP